MRTKAYTLSEKIEVEFLFSRGPVHAMMQDLDYGLARRAYRLDDMAG